MNESYILQTRSEKLMLARHAVENTLASAGLDYAIFTGVLDYRYRDQFLSQDFPNNKFLVWLTVDYLTNDIASLSDQKREEFTIIENAARQRPDQIFIIGSVLMNLDRLFDSAPSNLKTLWMGYEPLYLPGYDTLAVPQSKNRDSPTHWMSISSNCMHWRLHRPLAGVCLLGHGLESTGILRFSGDIFKDDSDWDNYCSFHRFDGHNEIDLLEPWNHIFRRGFEKTRLRTNQDHVRDPYRGLEFNNNCTNFLTNLKPLYDRSAVEIINETIFFQAGGMVTEKYWHTIYGDVFPIMLGAAGIVDHLRSSGLDMFDDVIDHSYDSIKEPLVRLARAIELNAAILRDRDLAWRQWDRCQHRFFDNRLTAQNLIKNCVPSLQQRLDQLLHEI